MSPPPRSSEVRWSGIWDQQHDSVVLMVESICGQGFVYTREVEEERQNILSKLDLKRATEDTHGHRKLIQKSTFGCLGLPFK
jgi:hypothetical protein